MKILGLTVTRTKAAVAPMGLTNDWRTVSTGGWTRILESFTGAWQRNVVVDIADVLTAGPVWACVTLIASDIAKCGINLIEDDDRDGIWDRTENSAYSPVLRKPNDYQNRITFVQSWLISKLTRGNTYVLKERDATNKVRALYVLDPQRVQVLVAPDGSVFYQLSQDYLAGVREASVTVPASEMIHDLYIALYHPLVGISPIHACGLAATQGLKIRRNSSDFFDNNSTLSGILTAPGQISQQTAERLEQYWNEHYAGPQNAGKIAALGDGLKFEPMVGTARDAELSLQLKDAALEVCNAFHVPAYMVGYGPPPNYNNIEALNQQYYSQCLQILIEALELCLDEGLSLPADMGCEVDLDNLLRMDSATKMEVATKGVRGGIDTPNEGRKKFNKKPLVGGDTVYLQDQDHSLEWLSRRDAMPIEAPKPAPAPPAAPEPETKAFDYSAFRVAVMARVKELDAAA